MTLTEYGEQFIPHARALWTAYEKFECSVAKLSVESVVHTEKTLNLQIPPLLTVAGLVPPILHLVEERFPLMHIDVHERTSHDILDYARSLTEEQLGDSILIATIPEQQASQYLADNHFAIETLHKFPMMARVLPNHPLAQKKSITRAELARENITCFNEPMVVDIIHALLDEYGGPHFAFKGSSRDLITYFPESVFISSGTSTSPSVVNIPIQDTVYVRILAITALRRQAYIGEVVDCIARVLEEQERATPL